MAPLSPLAPPLLQVTPLKMLPFTLLDKVMVLVMVPLSLRAWIHGPRGTSGKDFRELGDKLIKSLLSFYNQIMLDAVNFSPSGERFTYQFNLRELSKVVEGVL